MAYRGQQSYEKGLRALTATRDKEAIAYAIAASPAMPSQRHAYVPRGFGTSNALARVVPCQASLWLRLLVPYQCPRLGPTSDRTVTVPCQARLYRRALPNPPPPSIYCF